MDEVASDTPCIERVSRSALLYSDVELAESFFGPAARVIAVLIEVWENQQPCPRKLRVRIFAGSDTAGEDHGYSSGAPLLAQCPSLASTHNIRSSEVP